MINRFYPELSIPDMYHYYAYMANTAAFSKQRNVRYGKGVATSKQRALMKAIGEGIERYCSAIYDKHSLPLSSYNHIKVNALHPNLFCHYLDEFYSTHSNFSKFTTNTTIRWTKAININTEADVYVPASMVYLPYYHDIDESKIIQNISTGLACHSSYSAAAINAICEVLERDAFMLIWRNKLSPPRIKNISLPPQLNKILEDYKKNGFEIALFNITLDIKVPIILATMHTTRDDQPPFIIAGACSPSSEKAILSAIEELEHARQHGYYLRKKHKDSMNVANEAVKTQIDHALYWHNRNNLHHAEFITKTKNITSFPEIQKLDITQSNNVLAKLIDRFNEVGLDIYIANITSDDIASIGWFVLRAIIPGTHPLAFGNGYEQFNCLRLQYVKNLYGCFEENPELNRIPHPYP